MKVSKTTANATTSALGTQAFSSAAGGAVQNQASGSMDSAVSDLGDLMKQSVAANSSMLSSQMAASQANAQNGMAAQQAMAAQNQAESLNEAEIKMTNKATDGVKSAIS